MYNITVTNKEVIMASLIQFIMSNFTLTFFVLSIFSASISLIIKNHTLTKALAIQTIFSHFLLFNIGFCLFYNFIMHVFFGDMAAQFIGWAQSPFQLEVGFASLGLSVVGILAFWQGIGFRAAAVIAPAFFLLGAAGGHIYQMITSHNFAPGNAGIIFWSDIIIPALSFYLLYLQYKNPIKK